MTSHVRGFGWCLLVLTALLAHPGLTSAQDSTVTCLAPLTPECTLSGKAGVTKVPVNVRIARPDGTPIDTATLSFTTSHCCLSASTVRTNVTGVATVVWDGTLQADPDSAVEIQVWGMAAGAPVRRTIRLHPLPAPPYALIPVDSTYIWFRDDQLPSPVNFLVENPDSGKSVTRAQCDAVQVSFTPHLGGTAGPTPAFARWNEASGTCTVGATWKLANTVGDQHLNAAIVGTSGRNRVDANVRAISRHPPRFVAGFGVMAEKEEGQDRILGVFGIDFPVFHQSTCPLVVCERVRVVLGSSFEEPQRDYYAGVVLIPLFWGPSREGILVQVSANYASGGRFFGAMNFDANSLLQFAVSRFLPK